MGSVRQISRTLSRRPRLFAVLRSTAILIIVAAGVQSLAQELLPVENVRLPLARHPDGSIHRQLHAATATMSETGPIVAEGVRVETFTPEGELEMVVEAVQCEYDRNAGKVTSTEAVKAVGRGIELTGKGFKWNIKGEQLRILEDVRVQFNRTKTSGEFKE